MLHVPGLYISENDKGLGVFTAEELSKGDVIEICPIVKIPIGQLELVDQTIFYNYYFLWEEEGFEACLALGYGSLYNHSPTPNARVILNYHDQSINMEVVSEIKSGTEILIDYTGGIRGGGKLWFQPI